MPTDGTNSSKHTAAEEVFIGRVSARRLIDFRTYVISYVSRFLDRDCIALPALRKFLEAPAAGDLSASTFIGVSAAGRAHCVVISISFAMLARSFANQTLSDDSETDTRPFSKPVHPNLGVEQQLCRTALLYSPLLEIVPIFRPLAHAHIVDVSSEATAHKVWSGHHESEVDARNILPETSACSRAPTARKPTTEEAIEEHYTKKVKKYQLQTFTTAKYG
ncbi:hypothetical protein B0H13DRAFT_2305465 [Mycena leptocephala]|nr:hypothetical protein B0H13DRAFT_2305465 [Mycena leptocephala]